MKLNFSVNKTNDGSIGLYNKEVDDIYHSTYGAYNEAVDKFINPSGLESFLQTHNKIKILDICSGMGYNLKAAVDTVFRGNPDCCIEIDCLEIDSYVFSFGLLYKVAQIDYDVHYFLLEKFWDNSVVSECMVELLENDEICQFLDEKLALFFVENKLSEIELMGKCQNNQKIHNIYYKYMSDRNKYTPKSRLKFSKNRLRVFFDDARTSIKHLEGRYDFIFHDGFTPAKQSVLWSYEFFNELKRIISSSGNITTYSSSAPVRAALIQSGFHVSKISSENRKTSGTFASLSKEFSQIPLSEEEIGLLKTRAGIVYHDEGLVQNHDEIIKRREEEVKNSSLASSSSYLKSFKNKNKDILK